LADTGYWRIAGKSWLGCLFFALSAITQYPPIPRERQYLHIGNPNIGDHLAVGLTALFLAIFLLCDTLVPGQTS
jgi:hypothetical protein